MSNFGKDTSAVTGLDLQGDLIDDRLALIQACCRRLISPRGCLTWASDPNYGTDIRQFIADVAPAGLISSAIINELLKEEGVRQVSADVTRADTSLLIKIRINASDANLVFTFTLDAAGISKLVVL